MERTVLTLRFDDSATRVAFASELEAIDPSDSPFRIILAAETQNMDNDLLQLILTFMQHGGLLALTAFIKLIRDILKSTFPQKTIILISDYKEIPVSSKMSNKEIKDIVKSVRLP